MLVWIQSNERTHIAKTFVRVRSKCAKKDSKHFPFSVSYCFANSVFFFVRLFAFGGEINYSFSFEYKACVLSVFAHWGDEMEEPARNTISYMHSNHMYISLLSELISIFRINSTIIQYFIVIARCNLNWTAFPTEWCNIKSCDVDKQIIHLRF